MLLSFWLWYHWMLTFRPKQNLTWTVFLKVAYTKIYIENHVSTKISITYIMRKWIQKKTSWRIHSLEVFFSLSFYSQRVIAIPIEAAWMCDCVQMVFLSSFFSFFWLLCIYGQFSLLSSNANLWERASMNLFFCAWFLRWIVEEKKKTSSNNKSMCVEKITRMTKKKP